VTNTAASARSGVSVLSRRPGRGTLAVMRELID
jgi:hypothetical protein